MPKEGHVKVKTVLEEITQKNCTWPCKHAQKCRKTARTGVLPVRSASAKHKG